MTAIILGGVGLFLVGMVLMTQGLQEAAGDTLRTLLHKFTRGPLTSLMTGTVFTALVQSSSATTLATIGFVSAGLITFAQSVGIILGANLGTTVTSWLVSLVGFKIKIDAFALPMIGIGALIKLFLKGRKAHFGQVLAGFGLIFLGIEFLQGGMSELGEHLDVSRVSMTGLGGRVLLVLFGVVATVVMQSSSAAVATTLAAVHTGVIGLEQAAAIVIGQNVGTTVTAGVGVIGASTAAKRTALAHVVFNVVTGLVAFLLLPVFGWSVGRWEGHFGSPDGAVTIAVFHTAFNLLGVCLFLPLLARFSAWIEKVLPDRRLSLLWRIQTPEGMVPEVAVDAARLTLLDASKAMLGPVAEAAEGRRPWASLDKDLEPVVESLEEVRSFLGALPSARDNPPAFARHLAAHHAADHLLGLANVLKESDRARLLSSQERTRPVFEHLVHQWLSKLGWEEGVDLSPSLKDMEARAAEVTAQVRRERARILEETAAGELSSETAGQTLGSLAWADRVGRHAWRAAHHLWAQERKETLDPPREAPVDRPDIGDEDDVAAA